MTRKGSILRNSTEKSGQGLLRIRAHSNVFFGFQPGKGMETYQRQKQPDKKEGKAGTEGPMKPEERFASFFERIR